MRVGELAEKAEVSVQTVRYYERRGLLAEPDRTSAGYRMYSQEALQRLRFILSAKALGFTLSEIQELIDLRVDPTTTPADVRERAHRKVAATKAKIADLRKLLRGLERLIGECNAGGPMHSCALMHSLEAEEDN